MTEVYRANGLSIQVFDVPRATTASATDRTFDITLDRPGRFLGASAVADVDTAAIIGGPTLRTVAGAHLNYGDSISQVRYRVRNTSGLSEELGGYVVLFIGVGSQ